MLKSLLIRQLCYGAMNLKCSSVPGTLLAISWHRGMFLKVKLKWIFKNILLNLLHFINTLLTFFRFLLLLISVHFASINLHSFIK